jgi:predicted DNA-binding transcriptional regulator AlpA
MSGSDKKLNCREVACQLGMSVSWVYLHTKPGFHPRVPHQRLGRALRFLQSEIEEFIRSASYRLGPRGAGKRGDKA